MSNDIINKALIKKSLSTLFGVLDQEDMLIICKHDDEWIIDKNNKLKLPVVSQEYLIEEVLTKLGYE